MPNDTPAPDPPGPAVITNRLEALMRGLGLRNRSTLAERLGYSRSQLYAIEKGEVPVTRKFLISLESLEVRAEQEENKFTEPPAEDDGVVRLIRGLDFPALCSTIESGVSQLRTAGRMVPAAVSQINVALQEIINRAPAVKINSYIKDAKASK